MATTLARSGRFLKVVVNAGTPKYIPFKGMEIKVSGDNVIFEDGNIIDWNNVSSPSVTSAEDLADQIGTMITTSYS